MFKQKQDSGVSPVIGIILMVAVTVGLVALASTIVFDLGSNVNEPADVSANLNYDEGDSEISAEVVRNENADRVFLRAPVRTSGDDNTFDNSDDGTKTGELEVAGGAGETGTEVVDVTSQNVINTSTSTGDDTQPIRDRTAELVAVVDGNEQVLNTVQYSNGADSPS